MIICMFIIIGVGAGLGLPARDGHRPVVQGSNNTNKSNNIQQY